MDAEVKGLFWNLAAITFIAVSVVSGIAFFATTALHMRRLNRRRQPRWSKPSAHLLRRRDRARTIRLLGTAGRAEPSPRHENRNAVVHFCLLSRLPS